MVSHERIGSFVLVVILLLVPLIHAAGEEPGTLPRAESASRRLGWTPEEACAALGAPESVFPFRGRTAEEDNVVFYYPDHSYLFWFRDRVWQVRFDGRWEGTLDGVKMGMTRPEITALWGPPIDSGEERPTWTLPDRGYPVRIRLFFDAGGGLDDLYVFRSDW